MADNETIPATAPTPTESVEPKPMSYTEAIAHLSSLEFETNKVFDGEVPPNVEAAIQTTSAIFKKTEQDVLSDLIDKRIEEAEEQRVNDELMYGHLSPYDR